MVDTLETEVDTLAFNDGAKFESLRNVLKELNGHIQVEKDPSEREAIVKLAKHSYETAEELAKKYGAVDLLQDHSDLYQRFQELARD